MSDNVYVLIDINELSRRLSIPKGTLYNWVYLRRIPFIKAGRSLRFDAQEVIQSLPHCDYNGSGWPEVERSLTWLSTNGAGSGTRIFTTATSGAGKHWHRKPA